MTAPTAEAPPLTRAPSPSAGLSPENYREGPCGDATCLFFAGNAEAATYLLRHYQPNVMGFGEAHSQAASTAASAAQRYAETILPALAPEANFLLVELAVSPSGCDAPRERVQQEASAITEGQAETNQGDYFELGRKARELGLVPDILRPSCDDFRAVATAGDEATLRMMEMIGRLSGKELLRRMAKAPKKRPVVLAYGGGRHNDVTPDEPYRAWSYGPGLMTAPAIRYLEVDLVVPEGLETSPWSRLTWFPEVTAAFAAKRPSEAVLVPRSLNSVALLLAEEVPKLSEEPPEGVQD